MFPDDTSIIFAHPCKLISDIIEAEKLGVEMCTFDSADELEKLSAVASKLSVVLRIAVDDSTSLCPFSKKFGVVKQCDQFDLVDKCADHGLNFIGVSFHVGSGCRSVSVYQEAIRTANDIFGYARAKHGIIPWLLDIGGGFSRVLSINDISDVINDVINESKELTGCKVISEPGRFFVECCADLYARITTIRMPTKGFPDVANLYITNGVYQDLNCIIYDGYKAPFVLVDFDDVEVLRLDGWTDEKSDKIKLTVWGPTCDSLDIIGIYSCTVEQLKMINAHKTEYLLKYENLGAYSMSGGCPFNGYAKAGLVRMID